jgi:hypothetical protein
MRLIGATPPGAPRKRRPHDSSLPFKLLQEIQLTTHDADRQGYLKPERGIEKNRQKQSLLGNLVRTKTSRFVSLVAFCKNAFGGNRRAPGGRAPPRPIQPSNFS